MRVSTKPFYKLFNVVYIYFWWMFLVIERIYDDRVPPKCPQNLEKMTKNKKNQRKVWIIFFEYLLNHTQKFFNVIQHYFLNND